MKHWDRDFLRTRVKICGITREEDLAAAVDAGADAIGLVFHAASRRAVTLREAETLCRRVPAFVTIVGLFLDDEAEWVRRVLDAVPLDLLQFHGTESPDYCRSFGRRYIKTLAMGGNGSPAAAADYPDAAGFLLDGHAPGELGGSGRGFDWTRMPREPGRAWILAGGLRPDNVAAAVAAARPYGVDVSSGVEQSPGVKDPERIIAFISEVSRVQER